MRARSEATAGPRHLAASKFKAPAIAKRGGEGEKVGMDVREKSTM